VNGRFINAGQVCLSPEYVFVEECIIDKVLESLKDQVKKLYGGSPKTSEDYCRVINEFHTNRLSDRVNNPGKGAIKICGGDFDLKERYVEPAIFKFDNMEDMKNSNLAKEEIFGPIMYLVPYKKLSDCIDYINSGDKPLAMYYFGTDKNNLAQLCKYTSSGGILTNDTIVHFTNEYLPLGGVGVSGYGAYHGKWGFDGLSHLKPVMERRPQVLGLRYPPFKGNENIMRLIIKYVTFNQSSAIRFLLFVVLFLVAFFLRSRLFSAGRGFVNGFLFE
jgi:aldehyde dehydrogenase (NAD+)